MVKEKKADCEKEQVNAFSENVVFYNLFFHRMQQLLVLLFCMSETETSAVLPKRHGYLTIYAGKREDGKR